MDHDAEKQKWGRKLVSPREAQVACVCSLEAGYLSVDGAS